MAKTFVYTSTSIRNLPTPVQKYEVGILIEKNGADSIMVS